MERAKRPAVQGGRTHIDVSRWCLLIGTAVCILGAGQKALANARSEPDLADLSLEELMDIEVTTASRRLEGLSETAAPVYVITGDELRRSGARTLPDVLRSVPGVYVGSVDANKWAVSARGFSGLFANKLLVLIDGRSVYAPLFSGVFWEAQDVPFHDVARIEVIRGPGASLWGANAVNGIINVITRPTDQTQGTVVQLGAGTEERGFGSFRHGGRLSPRTTWRLYGKAFSRDASDGVDVSDRADDWWAVRGGARVDWRSGDGHRLAGSAEAYGGAVGQLVMATTSAAPPYSEHLDYDADISGGHLMVDWSHRAQDGPERSLQAYYDRSTRKEPVLEGTIEQIDVDFQQHHKYGRHDLIWGGGYRLTRDDYTGSFTMSMDPAKRDVHLFSGFAQLEFTPVADRVRLTGGAKVERNSFTGIEVQPGVRAWWRVGDRHSIWAAYAGAARTPSRSERDFRAITSVVQPDSLFPGSPVALIQLVGEESFDSERMRAFDAGYRALLSDYVAVDLAGFRNTYSDVRTNEPDLAGAQVIQDPRHLLVPVRVENRASAGSWGLEAAMDLQRPGRGRLRAAYSFLRMDYDVDPGSGDSQLEAFADEEAEHRVSLRGSLDLVDNLEADFLCRYVGQLRAQGVSAYFTADVRLAWQLRPGLQVSVVGQNLLDSPRTEYLAASSGTLPSRVERALYVALTWGR